MTVQILPPGCAPAQPPDAVCVRLLGDSVVALRPLQAGEREPLLAVFEGMSSASRAQRYLTGMARLPATTLDMLTAVDGHRHVAWLASMHGQPVGIARSVRDDSGVAEIAVEVTDDHHGLGIASVLVDAVTTVAAVSGVRRVRASLTPYNEASRRLVTRLGVRLRVVDDLLGGEGPLRLLDPPRIDRQAVLALSRRVGAGGTPSPPLSCRPHLNATSTASTEAGGRPHARNTHLVRKEPSCPPLTSMTRKS